MPPITTSTGKTSSWSSFKDQTVSGNTSLFEIKTIKSLPDNSIGPVDAPYFCRQFILVWVKSGTLKHCIDSHSYELQNALYGIAPGHLHQLTAIGKAEGYIIYFSAESISGISAADLLFNTNIFQPYPINIINNISEETRNDVEESFYRLIKEFNQYALLRFELLSSFMKILLSYLSYQNLPVNNQSLPVKNSQAIQFFFTLLNDHYKTKKQVSDYASEMSITPSYLNELIKKGTGMPASYHIRQRIILEAKRQATLFGLTMKETAYLLGFDDLSHFSKFFKSATGFNFSDFKKQGVTL